MEFQTDAQKETYDKILPWMKELFGVFLKVYEDAPKFGVMVGSAYTVVGVYAWGEGDATISSRSYVVTKVELVPELMRYLLLENDRMRFGAFGIDDEDDVFFEQTIVGSTCDKEEIKTSVLAVVQTADDYDDVVRQRWGGDRAVDRK